MCWTATINETQPKNSSGRSGIVAIPNHPRRRSAQHTQSGLQFAFRVSVPGGSGDFNAFSVDGFGFLGAAELFQRLPAVKALQPFMPVATTGLHSRLPKLINEALAEYLGIAEKPITAEQVRKIVVGLCAPTYGGALTAWSRILARLRVTVPS